jgi:hypothetical protein
VRLFARTWMLDLKERKIRVNPISPGPIDTPGLDGLAQTEGVGEQLKASLVASVPLGRLGTPDEIARPRFSSPRTIAVSSPAPSYSSTAAPRKSERSSSWSSSRATSSPRSRRLIRSPGVKRASASSLLTVSKVRIYFMN